MTRTALFSALLAGAACFASCKKDQEPTISSALVGSWQLTNRQCYCVPGPLPNETITFTNNGFSFYSSGQLTNSGTYASALVTSFCGGGTALGIRLTGNVSQQEAIMTLTGNTLVLDYGGPCDAPVDTYQRQP